MQCLFYYLIVFLCYRIRILRNRFILHIFGIGSYYDALGGCDAIVFTAGIGENNGGHRAAICEYLDCLGVKIDAEKNKLRGEDIAFTGEGSKIKTFIIPTDEELMIAQDTMDLLN